jgi:hypothetical protein
MYNFFTYEYGISKGYALSAAVTAVAIAGGLLIATSVGDVVRYVKRNGGKKL